MAKENPLGSAVAQHGSGGGRGLIEPIVNAGGGVAKAILRPIVYGGGGQNASPAAAEILRWNNRAGLPGAQSEPCTSKG